jgi:hypothetical protein
MEYFSNRIFTHDLPNTWSLTVGRRLHGRDQAHGKSAVTSGNR